MVKDWQRLIPQLQKVLDDSVSSGEECGLQLAIYDGGKLVVDLASGTDSPDGAPVTQDSLFPIFSCGKGVLTTAMHRLVEKGLIDYDTRIGDVWPEFACNGKEDVRLWHIMTHRAGLQGLPKYGHLHELADWRLMCDRMAAAEPAWTPGTKCAYHAITFAWLMGETATRVTGKPVRQVVIDEVLKPLGIDNDFFFGTTDDADQRFVPINASRFPKGNWCADFINDPVIRHAVIPSANGVTNARALARHYATLIGEVDGVRLLSQKTIENATFLRRANDDPPINTWAKFGLGYALCGPAADMGCRFGHGGAAGAEGFADKANGIALAFTKNKPLPSHPIHPIRDRISEVLGLPRRVW